MQIDRLLETLFLLLKYKKTTALSLADRFKVSERTIYRDIDTLSLAGIPVYSVRGNGGGIFLDEDYLLERNFLTKTEKEQMLTALQLLRATNLFSAETLLNKYQTAAATADDGWLTLELNGQDTDSGFQECILLLKKSIFAKRQIRFIYYNQYGQTSLETVSPAQIIYRQNRWHLLAFCQTSGDYQMYRLDHMQKVTPTERTAALPAPVMPPPADTVNVRLKFSKRLWYKTYDDFYGWDIQRNDDGSYELEFQLLNDDSIYAYLISFGNNVEILSPRWLKEKIVKKLKVFLNNNQI